MASLGFDMLVRSSLVQVKAVAASDTSNHVQAPKAKVNAPAKRQAPAMQAMRTLAAAVPHTAGLCVRAESGLARITFGTPTRFPGEM